MVGDKGHTSHNQPSRGNLATQPGTRSHCFETGDRAQQFRGDPSQCLVGAWLMISENCEFLGSCSYGFVSMVVPTSDLGAHHCWTNPVMSWESGMEARNSCTAHRSSVTPCRVRRSPLTIFHAQRWYHGHPRPQTVGLQLACLVRSHGYSGTLDLREVHPFFASSFPSFEMIIHHFHLVISYYCFHIFSRNHYPLLAIPTCDIHPNFLCSFPLFLRLYGIPNNLPCFESGAASHSRL